MDHVVHVVSKKVSLYPRSSKSPMLSWNFMCLHFAYRYIIHFELIEFVKGLLCVQSFFACPVPVPFVKETIFAPLYCLYYFVRDQLTIFMWVYFYAVYSVALIYLSILSLTPYCLYYCSNKVIWQVLKLDSVSLPVSLFSFSIVLGVLSCLLLHINCTVSLQSVYNQFINIHKISFWDFDWGLN